MGEFDYGAPESFTIFLAIFFQGLFYSGLLLGFAGVISAWFKVQDLYFSKTVGALYILSVAIFIISFILAILLISEDNYYYDASDKAAIFLMMMATGVVYGGILASFGFISSRLRS